jgi:hypothetical protein
MSIIRHLLTRASSTVASGGSGQGQPKAQPSTLPSFDQLLLGQPSSVMQVMIFRDQELVYRQLYDPRTDRVLAEPERQLAAVHGVLDFMRDAFGPQGNYVSYQVGRWQITGMVEGA